MSEPTLLDAVEALLDRCDGAADIADIRVELSAVENAAERERGLRAGEALVREELEKGCRRHDTEMEQVKKRLTEKDDAWNRLSDKLAEKEAECERLHKANIELASEQRTSIDDNNKLRDALLSNCDAHLRQENAKIRALYDGALVEVMELRDELDRIGEFEFARLSAAYDTFLKTSKKRKAAGK